MAATTPFEYFVNRGNVKLVEMLERNHNLSGFLMGLIDKIELFASERGLKYDDIKVTDAWIAEDGTAGFRIARV